MYWFGKNCEHLAAQWEDEFEEYEPVLVFCNHIDNAGDCEGNCVESLCPLGKKNEDFKDVN